MTNARGKGRPRSAEAAEIDRTIREAALKVLLEQGEAATMNAVAVAAGLSRRTLYARYPNKTDLFVKVIGELLGDAQSLDYDRGGTAEDRLRNYIEAAFQAISRPQSKTVQRLLSIDPTYIGVLKSEMLSATQRIFYDPLHDLLSQAHERGELVVDAIEDTARVVLRSVFTESLVSDQSERFGSTHGTPESYARFLARLVIGGLAPR